MGGGRGGQKKMRSRRDKDFWNKSLIFVSKDENLIKAHNKGIRPVCPAIIEFSQLTVTYRPGMARVPAMAADYY